MILQSWPCCKSFCKYDTIAAYALKPVVLDYLSNEQGNLARTFTYYCINQFFLKENQLINNLKRITHLPAIIVHGRFDAICRAKSAFELHKNWPGSEIFFIQDAGHSASEEDIAKALIMLLKK